MDLWLKMPGALFPNNVANRFEMACCGNDYFEFCICAAFGAGSRRRQRSTSFPVKAAFKHTCPVVNCGRVFDNASLLDGHLKR